MSDRHDPGDGVAQQLVGQIDDVTGSVVLTGWVAGPAGWVGVHLAGGAVELLVDHADPASLARLTLAPDADLDDARGETSLALASLFGGDWPEIRQALRGGLSERPRRVRSGSRDGGMAAGRTIAALGRLAVIEAEAAAHASGPLARAVAGLEAGVLRAEAPAALLLSPTAGAVLTDAASHLLSLDVDDLTWSVDWRGRLELAALATRAAARLDERPDDDPGGALARALREVARRWRGEPDTGTAAAGGAAPKGAPVLHEMAAPAAAAPAAMMPAPAAAPRPTLARAAGRTRAASEEVPLLIETDPALDLTIMSARLEGAHLHVTARTAGSVGATTPLWLRVFRRDRRPVLLGLGPLAPNDFGSAVARVLLPAELRRADVLADITARPDEPWRSPAVRTTQRAVRVARDACRAERTDDPDAAAAAWRRSAALWDHHGDDRRAGLARQYAAGGSAGTDPRPRGRDDRRLPLAPFVLDHLG